MTNRPLRSGAVLLLVVAALWATTDPVLTQRRSQGRWSSVMVNGREAVDGEVLVRFRTAQSADAASQEQARAEFEVDADDVETVGRRGLRRMHSRRLRTPALIAALQANPDVELVEPNYIIHALTTPNDPSFGNLWGLLNTGQNIGGTGIPGVDIRAAQAWDISTGSRANVIAVIDTGIDYNHPDLAANVWSAPTAFTVTVGGVPITCPAGSHGFNAINNTCNPMDDHNHGTHVSGTIGGVGNNGVGVAGVNWVASIMGAKFLSVSGSGTTSDAIKAIDFTIQAKQAFAGTSGANVRVLSNSWGGGGYSQSLLDAINRANAADMLFVAAAGNDTNNNDAYPSYPASYNAPNMVAVAATDNRDRLASFSNYGRNWVHLGAPGVNVLSTTRSNTYAYYNGTSMATPHVSGAAALLLSACPMTTAELKAAILTTVDPVAGLASVTSTGGRLNVNTAMRNCRPAPVLAINGGNSPITVAAGTDVTVTMTGGFGGAGDWFSLARTSDLNPAFNTWTYVGGGLTTRTWTATMPAALGTYEFRLFSNNTFTRLASSAVVTVADINPLPAATSLQPVSLSAGSAQFALTVTGTGFKPSSVVHVGGSARTTSYVSATSLIATIPATDVATTGSRSITVISPAPGGGTSNAVALVVTAPPPAPTVTMLNAASAPMGVASFPLTVTGTNFAGTSTIRVDGAPRVTTYVSATTLATTLPASDLQSAGFRAISVSTPAPGGGTSNSLSFAIVGPTLTPNVTLAGAGAPVTVTLTTGPGNGGDWLALARIGDPNQSFASWTYVGGVTARTWTVNMPPAFGAYEFRLFSNNTFTRLAASSAITVANLSPLPVATSIQPASLAAGSAAFALTVTGSGFVGSSVVSLDGVAKPTTFVSATTLSATISAGDVSAIGSRAVTVATPGPGGGTSSAVALSVTAPPPAPTLTLLSPASVPVGSATSVVVTGTNFTGTSVVQVGGLARSTTYTNATTLTALLTPADVASAGPRQITVVTPAPGGGTSNAGTVTVVGPMIAVSATIVPPGAPITVTLSTGPGGAGDWLSLSRVGDPLQAFATWAYVGGGTSKVWPLNMPAALGAYEVRLFANNTFTLLATSPMIAVANINPAPAAAALQPSQVPAGSAAFTLTVTGSGFVPASTVMVDGVERPTSFVSGATLTAALLSTDVAALGTRSITVETPAPGGGTSGAITLTIVTPPPAPVITTVTPSSMATGAASLALTVTGTDFAGTSVVRIGGVARTTTFVSPTTLIATLLPSDVASAGSRAITAVTPAPGGGTSNAAILTIVGPALSPSATLVAPGAPVTVTLSAGPGGPGDWLSLARVGDPNGTFVTWTYVGGGTGTVWTVAMPGVPGDYEFRLFSNNTFTRVGTSLPIGVR